MSYLTVQPSPFIEGTAGLASLGFSELHPNTRKPVRRRGDWSRTARQKRRDGSVKEFRYPSKHRFQHARMRAELRRGAEKVYYRQNGR